MSWNEFAGLNRITEAAAKELMVVKVAPEANGESDKKGMEEEEEEALEDPVRGPEVLAKLNVKEILVRRWVPSQEREEEA